MNKSKRFLVALMAILAVMSANAQFRFGLRAGTEVNRLSMELETFEAANRAGFCAGPMIEFVIPVVKLGFDLSAMYVHRTGQFTGETADKNPLKIDTKGDYIEIPLNLKYKLNIPAISKIIMPYVAAGPSVSILVSKKAAEDFYHDRTCDLAFNVGAGVEIIKHLQIGASYGFGLNKIGKFLPDKAQGVLGQAGDAPIEGKNNYWTLTAAWLF